MAKRTKSSPVSRKKPKQERAKATVEILLQATHDCLERKGLEGLNTTFIAERAGVSVGTLYQYFPNREALVAGLVQKIGEQEEGLVREAVKQASNLEEALTEIIRQYFQAVSSRPKLFAPLMQAIYSICTPEDIHRLENEGVKRMFRVLRQFGCQRKDLKKAAFITSYTYIGLLRFSSLVRPAYLTDEEFVGEVVDLVVGYACLNRNET